MLRSSKIEFDQLFKDLGGFSYFQWKTILLASIPSFLGGIMVVAPVFTGFTTEYRCKIPLCDNDLSKYSEDFLNFTTPWDENTNKWSQCQYYSNLNLKANECSPQSFNTSYLTTCSEWVYENKVFQRTTMTQFDLTCRKYWLVSMGTSAYMIGMFIGAIGIGFVSDYFGRRFGLLLSILLVTFGAVVGAFSPSYEMLLVMRTITGAGGMGCFQVPFVLAIEYAGPRFRTACGININIPFALGECFLGFLAYCIRDWKHLQLVAVSPAIFAFFSYFFMPESFMWLISKGRNKEAIEVIEAIGSLNGRKVPSYIYSLQEQTIQKENSDEVAKKGLIDVLKSKDYGNKMGRKAWHLFVFTLAGLGCILSAVLPREQNILILSMNLIGKFGGSAAFGSIFLYSGELYPTECRAIGVGACSMSARIGGIISPFINTLKLIYYPLPAFVYGGLSLVAGCLIILLPETLGTELPQTIEDSEKFGSDQKICYLHCCNSKNKKLSRLTDQLEECQ
ncbi:Organic cation transporter protein [Armadillidium vulgare]|nr:Organic cation transporter protein [Armadillidium vulgare]